MIKNPTLNLIMKPIPRKTNATICKKIMKINLPLTAPICARCVVPLAIQNGSLAVFLAVSERIREIRLCMEIILIIHIAIAELYSIAI